MVLQASGNITLSDIQTEFGGANPIALSDYYRNGVEGVPDSPANAGIPTAGSITLTDFYSADALAFIDITWSGTGPITNELQWTNVGPNSGSSITLNSDGTSTTNGIVSIGALSDWLASIGVGNGNNFECRYTGNVGTSITGPSTFSILSSNRIFRTEAVTGSETSTFTLEVRPTVASGNPAPTESISVTLTNLPPIAATMSVVIADSNPSIFPGATTYTIPAPAGVTYTNTGAEAPITSIWTRQSGSFNISVDNSTDEWPTFSCTNTGNIEAGTWIVTYSEGGGVTATDTINLTFDFGVPV